MPAKALRVALDATPLLGPRTGIGHFCHELLAGLAGRSDLCLSAFGVTWRGRHLLKERAPAGVRVVRRPMAARPLRESWKRRAWPPIELWTGAIDVVHGTNYVVPPARRAAEVVTVHDLTFAHFPEMCTADVLEYPTLIRRAIDRGAWVQTASRFVAEELVEYFAVPAERVVAVAYGVPDAVQLLAGDPKLGRRLAGAERYLLAMGTIEPRKNLPALVHAFEEVADAEADVNLVVAGPDGWGLDAFAEATTASRHRQRIRRLGYVDAEKKAALFAGASVFAYPSVYEGFGLPPLEAMIAGVPVVATAVGALPEVLGDGALLVPGHDMEALAGGLTMLLSDEDLRVALIARGHQRVRSYSWGRCTDGLLALYQRASGATG